jgi:hypothetical protein
MRGVYDAWARASNAAGSTWEDASHAAADYAKSAKANVDEVREVAWREWVAAAGADTDRWPEVETAARSRWADTHKGAKAEGADWDAYLAQTREGFRSGGMTPGWLHNVTDAVACAWDDTKCAVKDRVGGAWAGLKNTLHMGGGAKSPEELRREMHGKVDELYEAAGKAEL